MMMTHIQADGAGGPEVLKLATGPAPEPKPDEVLIRVRAAGVTGRTWRSGRGAILRRPAPVRGWGWRSRSMS